MRSALSELNGLLLERDRRHVQLAPAALSQQVASEIVLMQTLHDRDYRPRSFIVEARDEGAAIPVDDPLPRRLRMRFVGVQRIVDDDQIGAASGKRSANGGRIPAASLGSDELETGFFGQAQAGED